MSCRAQQLEAIDSLATAARAFVADRRDAESAALLEQWPPPPRVTRDIVARPLPVLRWMDGIESLATPDTHPLVALLAASAERLRWAQTYTRDDFESRFLDRYGWSELIGLRGPFASDSIAVGFLLLGPDVEYPPHHHAAEEVYYPLAGRAHWQHGDQQFVIRAPGECIHHAPRTPHAMKTGSEPLLALYAWRGGDLAEKSTLSRQASKR